MGEIPLNNRVLTKAQWIDRIQYVTGFTKADSAIAHTAVMAIIIDELERGKDVMIPTVGLIKHVLRKPDSKNWKLKKNPDLLFRTLRLKPLQTFKNKIRETLNTLPKPKVKKALPDSLHE